MKFSEDFVHRKHPAMGVSCFYPLLNLNFVRKMDCGLDDLHVAANPRSCRRQKDEGLSSELLILGAGVQASVAEKCCGDRHIHIWVAHMDKLFWSDVCQRLQ